jgi:hypothetical protein
VPSDVLFPPKSEKSVIGAAPARLGKVKLKATAIRANVVEHGFMELSLSSIISAALCNPRPLIVVW